LEDCVVCDGGVCIDDRAVCGHCEEPTCPEHAAVCDACGETFCIADLQTCSECGDRFCETDRHGCRSCGDVLCTDHVERCSVDGEPHCRRHLETCDHCEGDRPGGARLRCPDHLSTCSVGAERLCADHEQTGPITEEPVCADHTVECSFCEQGYSTAAVENGRCETCRQLGGSTDAEVIGEVDEEFRKTTAAKNGAFVVVYGKKLIGAPRVVVLDAESGAELHRRKVGIVERIKGVVG
jgi:hypothetical protein